MLNRIGIDRSYGDIFESVGARWRVLLPPPLITDAILDPPLPVKSESSPNGPTCVFREDVFDPAARIRRGRLYELANMQQPSDELVLPYPIGYLQGDTMSGRLISRQLHVYHQYQLAEPPRFVAIGSTESLWEVLFRPERISTGEFLFTLKARHAFGILPEIDPSKIPAAGRAKAIETLEKLTDAAHRESPGSVIDRACDAAQWCLATWASATFGDNTFATKHFDTVIQEIRKKKAHMIATDAGNVVRILHARGHSNAQVRHGTRPVVEDDAELAVKAMAFILRELGWATT